MPTPTDPNQAQAWVTGTPPDQTVDFYIPRGNTGPMGPVGPQGPSLVVGSVETNMGPAAPGTVGPQGLTGPKGDPGGFTEGTILGTADLNTIITPGIYRQIDTSGIGSLVRNYPYASAYGSMLVLVTNGDDIEQIFYPQFYTSSIDGRTFYRRNKSLGVWNPWRAYNTTRVDQTAGRAIYQWDDLNNREQLIHGDTGWRDASSSILNGHTGTIKLRRVGFLVHVIINVTPNMTNVGLPVYNWPTGFVPEYTAYIATRPSSAENPVYIYIDGTKFNVNAYSNSAWGSIIFGFSFSTITSWPTALPGTASGGIPNA